MAIIKNIIRLPFNILMWFGIMFFAILISVGNFWVWLWEDEE